MKVQLIVVQGKPEGKVIPLVQSPFRIGRGETCHLRPNSEQVSREHAEFTLADEKVFVRDLGSRNGTLVNGKAVTEPYSLKDRDLVTVGHLTFAVSIQGLAAAKPVSPAPVTAAPAAAKPKITSLDDVSGDEIDSWLIADNANPTPERPSGIYGGDTITIAAFRDSTAAADPKPAPAAPAPVPVAAAPPDDDNEFERLPEGDNNADRDQQPNDEDNDDDDEDDDEETASLDDMPEELIDESNPFYVKKKAPVADTGPTKPVYKDTSDAAQDILRKMLERRKASKQ